MFFAIMNFTLSGAIGFVGILTLRKVSTPHEVVLASLPLLFALHQFTEGFVWLGVRGFIEPRALEIASGIFIYYAQGLLPFLIPVAIWLIEKKGWRKNILALLSVLGLLLAIYTMWGLSTVPSSVKEINNTLSYTNPWTDNLYDALIYVVTTCGALMLSSSIAIQLFGFFNLIGLSIIYLLRPYGFTSLWCLYAAAISGLLYFYFIERRISFLQEIKQKEVLLSETLQEELDALAKNRLLFSRRAL